MSGEIRTFGDRRRAGDRRANRRGAPLAFGVGVGVRGRPRHTPPCACGYPLVPSDAICPRCGAPTRPAA